MTLAERLKTIRVLYRQSDLLCLWGIPYEMRADVGQKPYDLWKARRDYVAPRPGHYGSKQIDLSDWIWLGQPGWWGHLSKEDQVTIQAFLDTVKEHIPGWPNEWSELPKVSP